MKNPPTAVWDFLRWMSGWSGRQYRYWAGVFRRLGVSLRAGVDILRVLETEAKHGGPRHCQTFQMLHERVRKGDPLWQAMQTIPDYFPPLVLAMVQVGEETGHLDSVLLKLSEHYERQYAVHREFLAAITWPITELLIAIAVIGLLIWLIGLLDITDILGLGLTGTSGLVVYLVSLMFIFLAGAGLGYSVWKGWWGTYPVRIAMRIPMLGKAMETAALKRFTWALGTTLGAGLEVNAAMRLALRSTHNPIYQAIEESCCRQLTAGQDFTTTLRASRVFPDEMLDTVYAAEIAGTLSESLEHLARQYEEESRRSAQLLAYILAGGVWVLVAGMIIAFIFRLAFFYIGNIAREAGI